MSEPTTTPDEQTPDGAQLPPDAGKQTPPGAADAQGKAKPAPSNQADSDGDKPQSNIPDWMKDPEQVFDVITKLRAENKERREKAEAHEAAQKAAQEAELKEQGRLQELLAAKEEELVSVRAQQELTREERRQDLVRHAVIAAAARANIADPEDAYKLANLSDIEIDEDGFVTGADKAIAALVEKKPYLIRDTTPPPPVVSPTNPAGEQPTGDIPQWIKDQMNHVPGFGKGRLVYHGDTDN